ncbi:MAG: DUF1302 domain-containing protein [Thermoanaerobaculia bacterium]|nr:MAG: DUF1302 domain-containing protein [Thermoanaerobaculia bacterium]
MMQPGLDEARRRRSRSAPTFILLALLAAPVAGIEGQKGDFSWSWGNTVSYGLLWRLDDPDPAIIGRTAGGTAFSVNGDDGNLNYESGIASNAVKWTSELEFSYRNFGGFVRGFAFYDSENEDQDRARTPLSDDAMDRVGSRAEIRDAFLWYRFDLGSRPGEFRVGRQVINWGESTFIQGGINAINPVDVSALRVPGAELRDALLPVGAALLSLKPSDNTSIEVYYQFDWEETKIDPVGSYFSTTDLAGAGATKVMLGFGAAPDSIPVGFNIPGNPVGVAVPHGTDREADDSGQYGAAFRLFAPGLGGTEFGLYYLSYNSRLPVIMARTGTAAALLVNGNYAASAQYFLEYPEDIQLYGLSFNAQLGRSGIALQGEVSHRQDVPLQVDDVELLYAALTPLRLLPPVPPLAPLIGLGNLLAATNQLGPYGFNEEIQGYRRFDTSQIQVTGTKAFSHFLGADQFVLVAEAGWSKVHDLPDQATLRLEAPGTYTSGNPIHTRPGLQPATEPASAFPTDTAWGYVIAGRLDYNNAFGPVNLSPRFSFAHDVDGVSPGPGGNFIDGRKALTVGFGFQYRINLEWDLSYTQYFGAGRYNLLSDRDFVAANIKYSF